MDLRERLQRMLGSDLVDDDFEPRTVPERSAGNAEIPGSLVETDLGPYWLRISEFPLSHLHGAYRLEDGLKAASKRIYSLTGDEALRDFSSDRAFFVDTETTSLAGGAGVTVFMTGIGYYHENRFRVEQYFMRDFDEELAMLDALNERTGEFDFMVSYFGKNFDRYRLEDRMNLLGMESKMPVDRHLDLYHTARRIYKGRFSNLKLKTLETELLGFVRQDDIPGSKCPEAYFSYVRGEDCGLITEVFEHNLWDILSLATLTFKLDSVVKNPSTPMDKYMLGRTFMKGGDAIKALPLLQEAICNLDDKELLVDANLILAKLLKKRKDIQGHEKILNILSTLDPDNISVLLSKAKFLEHVKGDYRRALALAEKALLRISIDYQGKESKERRIKDTAHRIARLKGKSGNL